eukprot:m.220681 g.220681  ORF g.220681 m.220681 type:complete len:110 (+) comp15117_c0_seq10:506-835(+)
MGHEATDVDAFYKVKWLLFGFWKRVTFLWGYFCLAELLFVGVIVGLCAYAGISWPDEESTGYVNRQILSEACTEVYFMEHLTLHDRNGGCVCILASVLCTVYSVCACSC